MNYSKVSPRLWTGDTGRALRGDPAAQIVAMYLMTSPHANMLGYYYLPAAYIATDTGLDIEGASKALQRLCEEGFCRYDKASEVVWVVEMARLQLEDTLDPRDKRVIGIAREYAAIPNNLFLQDFHDAYGATFHIPTARAFKGASKPIAVAVTTAVAVTPTVTVAKDCAGVPPTRPPREALTAATWEAYALAYRQRYNESPVRNAKVNGQLAEFVRRLPKDEAPHVAAFYVQSNNAYYARKGHAIGPMVADAEKLRTEWATGQQMTEAKAREGDRLQTQGDVWRELITEASSDPQTH